MSSRRPVVAVLAANDVETPVQCHHAVHQPRGPHRGQCRPLQGLGVKAEAAGQGLRGVPLQGGVASS